MSFLYLSIRSKEKLPWVPIRLSIYLSLQEVANFWSNVGQTGPFLDLFLRHHEKHHSPPSSLEILAQPSSFDSSPYQPIFSLTTQDFIICLPTINPSSSPSQKVQASIGTTEYQIKSGSLCLPDQELSLRNFPDTTWFWQVPTAACHTSAHAVNTLLSSEYGF